MNGGIVKGYAVKLSYEQVAGTSSHIWYLPHHEVINLKAQGSRLKAQGSRLKAQGSRLKAQGSSKGGV